MKIEAVRDHVEVIFDEPIYVNHKEKVAQVNTAIFNRIEQYIKENPLQWRGWVFLDEMVVEQS